MRAAFNNREVVRAARLLGEQRDWLNQTQFIRKIAADADSDTDHALARICRVASSGRTWA